MASPPPNLFREPTHDATARRRQAALEFLTGRIDFQRAPVLPYGQWHLALSN